MATDSSLLVRFNGPDRAALIELAKRLERNQAETIRSLVRETLVVLKEQDRAKEEQQKNTGRAQ